MSKNSQTSSLKAHRANDENLNSRRTTEEKRRQSHQDNFAARIRDPKTKPAMDRRRKRKTLADISAPRRKTNVTAVRFVVRSSDIFWVSALIFLGLWNAYIGTNNRAIIAPIVAGCIGAGGFIVMLFAIKAHQFSASETYFEHMKKVLIAAAAALGIWLSFALIIRPDTFLPDALAKSGLMATLGLVVLHSFYYQQAKRMHKHGALTPTIVMLGATESARRLIEENAKTRDLNILAIFDDRISRAPLNIHGVPIVGKIKELTEWEDLPYVDRIVVTLPSAARARKKEFIEQVRLLPNRIAFVVDEFENLNHVQQRLTEIAAIGMREVTGNPKSGRHIAMKRAMDVGISLIALTLGAPFLALIALMIKLDSPGPALFTQQRHGFNNRIFNVYKFRSMKIEDEDKLAAKQVTEADSRITKLGRIIRNTSIDELPQLINVLKGEMSLVGPRPHAVGMRTGDIESYKLVEEYAHRHKVKPGMTGWAQINGSRGPLHSGEDVAIRVRYDVEYIERSSLIFDIIIMLKTLPCLLGDSENIR